MRPVYGRQLQPIFRTLDAKGGLVILIKTAVSLNAPSAEHSYQTGDKQ
ncbi:MAG: hypothetical protein R3E31_22895 [Chloroflexota bacterium]